ncbi:MAG TPA: hypothetical protein PLX33_06500 [Alphaproteobacteria bacterium]|nr:hypothetical protein [Alphaproteobacteria bacterium]
MVKVLSPRQSRKYQLALAGVKKFQHILKSVDQGYVFYPLPTATFEKHLHEWDTFDLLLTKHLEERYLRKVRPSWRQSLSWQEVIDELKSIAQKKILSERFFELWDLYLRRSSIVTFIGDVQPYEASVSSMTGNDTRIVERYIYALWMHSKGYRKGHGKGVLGDQLLKRIGDLEERKNVNINRLRYYKGLIAPAGGLIRSVTGMTPEEISEYVEDEFFTAADFPEIFSTT